MNMKSDSARRKTFPLEIEESLHKALKYKAIESDQTLHSFIIETLKMKVQEEPAQYLASENQSLLTNGKKK